MIIIKTHRILRWFPHLSICIKYINGFVIILRGTFETSKGLDNSFILLYTLKFDCDCGWLFVLICDHIGLLD